MYSTDKNGPVLLILWDAGPAVQQADFPRLFPVRVLPPHGAWSAFPISPSFCGGVSYTSERRHTLDRV